MLHLIQMGVNVFPPGKVLTYDLYGLYYFQVLYIVININV